MILLVAKGLLTKVHSRRESRTTEAFSSVSEGLDHVAHDAAQRQRAGAAAHAHAALLLFTLTAQFPVPGLDALLLHRQRPVYLQQKINAIIIWKLD